jgi:hypothetical protein
MEKASRCGNESQPTVAPLAAPSSGLPSTDCTSTYPEHLVQEGGSRHKRGDRLQNRGRGECHEWKGASQRVPWQSGGELVQWQVTTHRARRTIFRKSGPTAMPATPWCARPVQEGEGHAGAQDAGGWQSCAGSYRTQSTVQVRGCGEEPQARHPAQVCVHAPTHKCTNRSMHAAVAHAPAL